MLWVHKFNLLIEVVWITNSFSWVEKLKGHFRLTSKYSEMKTLVLQDLFPFGGKKGGFLSSVYLHLGLFQFNFKVHGPKEKTKARKPVREHRQLTALAGRLSPRAHSSCWTQSSSGAALNPWAGGSPPGQAVGWMKITSLVSSPQVCTVWSLQTENHRVPPVHN